jgi:tRNA(Ile)-lysidine synthase
MLIEHIRSFVKKHKINNALVGFSGGVDSTVLLYILKNHTDVNVRAVYVNHSLSDKAEEWANFCAYFCYNYGIEFISEVVDANKVKRKSPEAIARDKRYEVYKKHLELDEVLFLGHHSDDQIETVLLQMLRGTGVSGLSGMPSFEQYECGYIARPLILETNAKAMITKQCIEEFANKNGITHIVDESNFINDYRRNFLRNEIIPKLKNEFGNINKTISKTAIACQKAKVSSDRLIDQLYTQCKGINGDLNFMVLKGYSDDDIVDILRYWMSIQYNQRSVSMGVLNEILKFVRTGNNDNNFEMYWGKYVLFMKNNKLDVKLKK